MKESDGLKKVRREVTKEKFFEVLKDGITFSGQVGAYVVSERVFEWVYSEIEAREKRWDEIHEAIGLYPKVIDLVDKIKSIENSNTILEGALKYQRERNKAQQEIIEAADDVIQSTLDPNRIGTPARLALEKYQQLKPKSQS